MPAFLLSAKITYMDLKNLYREIVNEHNLNPAHRWETADATLVLRGVNPSCGDDITLMLKLDNDTITDGSFTGEGCAISQASVDMMLDQIIGLSVKEALQRSELFHAMIRGEVTDEDTLEALDEAASLQDISHMPARVKCAMLGWRTMKEILEHPEKTEQGGS